MKRKEDCRSGRQPDSAEKRTPCNAEFSKNFNTLSEENQVFSGTPEEKPEHLSSDSKDSNTCNGQSLKNILEAATVKKEQRPAAPALPEDTEVAIAKHLIDLSEGRIKFCSENKSWMKYEKGIWLKTNRVSVHALIDKFDSNLEGTLKMHSDTEGVQKHVAGLRKRISGFRTRDNILKIMENSENCITPVDVFDAATNLLNFQNGTLELDTKIFREHRQEDFLTQMIATDYDKKATCPKFQKFLKEIFEGDDTLIMFVINYLGSCLAPYLQVQFFLFWYGDGANGKSILQQVILKILGSYSVKIPATALMQSKYGGDRSQNEVIRLKARRLVLASETEQGQRLHESLIKDLTGGDLLTGRRLYCETEEFQPSHKLVMYGNHKPRVVSTDYGIWRRIRVIPFKRKFAVGERRDPKELTDELLSETPGIINLLLKGVENARNGDLKNAPDVVIAENEEYQRTSDPVRSFLEERVLEGTFKKTITSGELFKAFKDWKLESNTLDFSSHISFTKHLKQLGYKCQHNRNKVTEFMGLKLK